jgi:hypothetical protein
MLTKQEALHLDQLHHVLEAGEQGLQVGAGARHSSTLAGQRRRLPPQRRLAASPAATPLPIALFAPRASLIHASSHAVGVPGA